MRDCGVFIITFGFIVRFSNQTSLQPTTVAAPQAHRQPIRSASTTGDDEEDDAWSSVPVTSAPAAAPAPALAPKAAASKADETEALWLESMRLAEERANALRAQRAAAEAAAREEEEEEEQEDEEERLRREEEEAEAERRRQREKEEAEEALRIAHRLAEEEAARQRAEAEAAVLRRLLPLSEPFYSTLPVRWREMSWVRYGY